MINIKDLSGWSAVADEIEILCESFNCAVSESKTETEQAIYEGALCMEVTDRITRLINRCGVSIDNLPEIYDAMVERVRNGEKMNDYAYHVLIAHIADLQGMQDIGSDECENPEYEYMSGTDTEPPYAVMHDCGRCAWCEQQGEKL